VKVQAEHSEIIVELDGIPCRVWNAVTEDGEQVYLFVHRVASHRQLEELTEAQPPVSLERTI